MASPFLHPGPVTRSKSLAVLYVSRDHLMPVFLDTDSDINEHGYAEGNVVNTRFGSFPHTTLLDMPWGSQVGASKVDTGSRGRRKAGQKRKLAELKSEDADSSEGPQTPKRPLAADSGYIHILQPTPETWTASLPHRTQVVYTPDYSYILHRLRVRPGNVIIEAGAGSGAFTHAAARAVFNGYKAGSKKAGRVWSFEFHQQRAEKLRKEILAHGLNDFVHLTHRDVCTEGFQAETPLSNGDTEAKFVSPRAEAIFLDLPAPWLALPHLTRASNSESFEKEGLSPLSPDSAVHICTFSPCIEQVTRTVAAMRQLGWVDIDLVELAHKRIDVRREFFGSQAQEGDIAVQNVEDAVERLKMVEERLRTYHAKQGALENDGGVKEEDSEEEKRALENVKPQNGSFKPIVRDYMLVHQPEPEIKTHTSYLVFAILPREWTEADEVKARAEWPVVHKEKKV